MTLGGRLNSLRIRIALFVGLMVTVFWLIAAAVTVSHLFAEVSENFDRDLRANAERILPIVLQKHRDDVYRPPRDEHEEEEHGGRRDDDDVEFVVTSERHGLLMQSREASEITFPTDPGYHSDDKYRYFVDVVQRGDVTIAVARPLDAREQLALAVMGALSMPLIVVIPLTLLGIFYLVGRGLRPIKTLEDEMGKRGPSNLSPISGTDMPRELVPVVDSGNRLLERVAEGFEAERSFASNAAHEMRTPLAGAIAQAQRLKAQSSDPIAVERAGEIEASLKRLSRYGEKLMQLARAEGARLRQEEQTDLRPVVRIVLEDFIRSQRNDHFEMQLPDDPVMSDLDPDALGIVLRNLVENALTHGEAGTPVRIELTADCVLTVSNDGETIPPATLERLGQRFMRGDGAGNGTGLGLSIIHIIAERSNATFELLSPRPDGTTGTMGRFSF